jgi:hypothetical protein
MRIKTSGLIRISFCATVLADIDMRGCGHALTTKVVKAWRAFIVSGRPERDMLTP